MTTMVRETKAQAFFSRVREVQTALKAEGWKYDEIANRHAERGEDYAAEWWRAQGNRWHVLAKLLEIPPEVPDARKLFEVLDWAREQAKIRSECGGMLAEFFAGVEMGLKYAAAFAGGYKTEEDFVREFRRFCWGEE